MLIDVFLVIITSILTVVIPAPCDLYDSVMTWRDTPVTVEVHWRLDSVCENSFECYGNETASRADYVQLCPVFIQHGDSVNITLPVGAFYKLQLAIGELFNGKLQ